MCGIVGAVNWADLACLQRMTDIQAHRGPDDSGVWTHRAPDGSHVALGSRRLAILDLSSAGHMPMSNADGTVWIVYNGETYNFRELRADLEARGRRFRSQTDTEVVLQLYEEHGVDCVRQLNGMFAFAICDLRPARAGPNGEPILFMARDHFGVKPLYYVHQGSRLAFASELKALLELPDLHREIDLQALHKYLTFLWVPEPETILRGVSKLPAGHYAVYQGGRLEITPYWDLAFPPDDGKVVRSEAELVEEVRERFRHSVRAQMVSDVPIGAFLSAGLDSTSIVAMMAQAKSQPIKTYTITFPPTHRYGESTFDNPRVAAAVAKQFGCDHHELVVEPQVADLLPRLIWHMDEPVADPALIMAYLVCREARNTATVLLSGIGGDELFAGYRKHYAHGWAQAYRRLPRLLRRGVLEPAVLALPALRGTPLKGAVRLAKKMMRSASLSPEAAFLMNSTYLDEEQKARLYLPEVRSVLNGADAWAAHRALFARVAHASFLHRMLYLDTKMFMVSLNLNYNDKMSMASSVEVRVPFLDPEFAQFVAWHVPPSLKLRGFLRPTTKYILRRAMEGILPDAVLRHPKAGFGAPIDFWLVSDLQEMVDDLLSPESLHRRGLFDPVAARHLIDEHRAGREDWSLQVWQLLTLELWCRTFLDAPVSPYWSNH